MPILCSKKTPNLVSVALVEVDTINLTLLVNYSSFHAHVYGNDFLDDPVEAKDLSSTSPQIVSKLTDKLNAAKPYYVRQFSSDSVYKGADPANFGDFWSPGWC